ncbi:putative metalloprotease CJM1_0395 family protein [Solibacillus daqui]|uniref:putative metalloprotease CJM1_0395 family protein n=1 Tax=Solibacillus daqui TaxID=2912187 RepID=UPI0023663C29|nr:putative metalloprotease CJM1_0395 family protein [Solibacillus daqui]
MKISSLLHGYNPDLEERKRSVQRKEVGDAYKKHAKYANASKNPMLQALENLLSGKTEKELHEADAAARKDSQQTLVESKDEELARPKGKEELSQLKQTEQEVIAHENAHKSAGAGVTGAITYTQTTGPDNQRYINGGEVAIQMPATNGESDETIALLERVRQAALAPAEPSSQDLRVAASASAQIQQVRADKYGEVMEEQEESAPFADEDFTFEMPEKFQKDFNRNPEEQTIFGKDLEKLLFQRTFNNAAQKYSSHIAMVKNGYRSVTEPTFSQVA